MTATAQPVLCYSSISLGFCRDGSCKYLAVVAMYEERVILFVEGDLHNRVHNGIRNGHLFSSLHIDNAMTDAISLHKSFEFKGELCRHKGAACD